MRVKELRELLEELDDDLIVLSPLPNHKFVEVDLCVEEEIELTNEEIYKEIIDDKAIAKNSRIVNCIILS